MYLASVPESSIGRVMLSIHRLWPSSWRSCVVVIGGSPGWSARRRGTLSLVCRQCYRCDEAATFAGPCVANLVRCERVPRVDASRRARVASGNPVIPHDGCAEAAAEVAACAPRAMTRPPHVGGLHWEERMRHGRI